MSKPLDCGMDNLDAYKLGLAVCETNLQFNNSDEIDRGLILRRVLEEKGFYLIRKDKDNGK